MNKKAEIYFISGVAGVGKSSLLDYLKELLPKDKFDIRDFDERGIPDGGGMEWHNIETLHWLEIGRENADNGKSTIICGFIHPERLRSMHKIGEHPQMKLILLHAPEEVIRQRLLGRYSTPESLAEVKRMTNLSLEEWLPDVLGFIQPLRALFEKDGSIVIDTENKTPQQVASEVIDYISTNN